MSARFIRQNALVLFAATLTACAAGTTRYSTAVSSLATPRTDSARSYAVLSSMVGVDTTNLQFIEAAAYLDFVLGARGFTRAARLEEADVAVFLSYGIGDPRTQQVAYSVPVFGQAPGSTTTVSGTVQSGGQTATVNGQARTQPDYGLLGYRTATVNRTEYLRHLLLVGVDLRQFRRDQTIRELWRTAVVSNGASGDLRLILPVLFVALERYVGTRTDRMIESWIWETDARLKAVRAAAAQPRP